MIKLTTRTKIDEKSVGAQSNMTAELRLGFLPCPFCGGEVDWCDCGNCHQIQCKSCGLQLDNNVIGADADTIQLGREDMRAWWNTRLTQK